MRAAGFAVLAGVVAAVMNTLLTRRIAGGALFGDFPPILSWDAPREDFTEIKIRHPEIDALPPRCARAQCSARPGPTSSPSRASR